MRTRRTARGGPCGPTATRRRVALALAMAPLAAAAPWRAAAQAATAPAPPAPRAVTPAAVASGPADGLREPSRLRRFAGEIVARLAAAADDGLDAADYGAQRLRAALDRQAAAPGDATAAARLDDALAAALLRYLRDLRQGRIDPRALHQAYTGTAAVAFDAVAATERALAAGSLAGALREALPPVPMYGALRAALARCRELRDHPGWQQGLPPLPKASRRGAPAKLEPGQPWAGVPLLAQRLAAWGDLAAPPAAQPEAAPVAYDGPLVDALRAFQRRHGLLDDGVLGRATLAELEVAPAQRARQIELTMERLRWTPLMQAPRMIVVNLPEFVLRAYEVQPDGRVTVRAQMKVIVGRALDTRTPQFDETLRFVEFSPYWNVPPSIARKELVPRLRRDPGHFAREGFEFVDGAGQVSTALSAARLDAVMAGALRIRQRPGPRNALGDIKFVFPNRDNIYLHHTPATALFERDRRDFSHGCIRVEKPVELARFVLQDEPGWSEARIREAMASGTSSTLRLAQPLRVLITYATALVLGGRLHFAADLYGHDRLLDAALQQRRRPVLPAP